MKIALVLMAVLAFASAQRITTIQLDGVQYYVSRMNPYSLELNYFLAYQYCRSLGLQLASFETKEKADTMTQYLKNAGYTKYDFWTSGNKLGTDMFLWMSTGLPFNATFNYMGNRSGNNPVDVPPGTEPQRVARESGDSGSSEGCVAMKAPTLGWEAEDCTLIKDFICEQTRCYYYNYGSIPVSATQGNRRPYITSTAAPVEEEHPEDIPEEDSTSESVPSKVPEDPVLNRLVTAAPAPGTESSDSETPEQDTTIVKDISPPDHIPDITSLFTSDASHPQKETAFDGLETHQVHTVAQPSVAPGDYDEVVETEMPNNALEDAHTVGPYDSVQDYVNDQDDLSAPLVKQQQEDDSSTILPEAEPAYRYNIKVRTNGKVLDPPSK